MQNPRQRHDPVRLFVRRLALLILLLLVIFGSFGVWHIYNKEREASSLNVEAQAQLTSLQTRETQLAADVASLQSERGVEAALREQYDMGDQGEQEVIIEDSATATPVAATSTSAFKAWVHKFFPWW